MGGAHGTPLVARAPAPASPAAPLPSTGGIVVEFARMNRILDSEHPGAQRASCSPAWSTSSSTRWPASWASTTRPTRPAAASSLLGGNLGENAGGPHCFKYGVTTNYVTGLEFVLADGAIVRTGGQAFDYPEYDLTGLVVGSEGHPGHHHPGRRAPDPQPAGVKTLMVPSAPTRRRARRSPR